MDNQRIQVTIGVSLSYIEKYREFEIARLKQGFKHSVDQGRLNEVDDWEEWIEEIKKAAPADLVQYMFEDSWKEFYKKKMGWL